MTYQSAHDSGGRRAARQPDPVRADCGARQPAYRYVSTRRPRTAASTTQLDAMTTERGQVAGAFWQSQRIEPVVPNRRRERQGEPMSTIPPGAKCGAEPVPTTRLPEPRSGPPAVPSTPRQRPASTGVSLRSARPAASRTSWAPPRPDTRYAQQAELTHDHGSRDPHRPPGPTATTGREEHPVDRVEALEAEELRLLAYAVGDHHLPLELALRVEELRSERALLTAASLQRARGAGDR